MPDNNYATKQDLADLRAHVDERFDQVIEATRDMQTEVLVCFSQLGSAD